jgi:hypothetical protein
MGFMCFLSSMPEPSSGAVDSGAATLRAPGYLWVNRPLRGPRVRDYLDGTRTRYPKGGVLFQPCGLERSIAGGPLTRLAFLRVSAVTVGGLAFGGADVARGAAAPHAVELAGFIELSELVTGAEELPVRLAPRYLEALDAAGLALPPSRLLRLAGFTDGRGPVTLAALERSAALRAKGARATVEAVAAAWWSGMVPTGDGGQRVLAYEQALVWRALPYAAPPSLCLGAVDAWSKPGRKS